ncbi:hypothetical protein V3C99_008021, partial [Haemonchus contortus]
INFFLLCWLSPNRVINVFIKHCIFGERPAHRGWVSSVRSNLPMHTSSHL